MAATPSASIRSRHSLYGIEDRIVIDIGSRMCLIGFSGEASPRACIQIPDFLDQIESDGRVLIESIDQENNQPSQSFKQVFTAHKYRDSWWNDDYENGTSNNYKIEGQSYGSISDADGRLTRLLRTLFLDHLLLDPRQRKVLVLENPLMRQKVKSAIARSLFSHLNVPSVSFVPHSICALMAVGRVTGLVVDVGQRETTIVPTFSSRSLLPRLTITSRGSRRFYKRLGSLIIRFGRFIPNPALGPSASTTSFPRSTTSVPTTQIPIPKQLLTLTLIEQIQSKLCFADMSPCPSDIHEKQQSEQEQEQKQKSTSPMELDQGQGDDYQRPSLSEQDTWTEDDIEGDSLLDTLEQKYKPSCKTTDARIRVPPVTPTTGPSTASLTPSASALLTGGTLLIPGWVRQCACEVLFEPGDEDESSIPEAILECLLKVPLDLRKPLASSILVCGGTAMTPSFISRLRLELLRILILAGNEEQQEQEQKQQQQQKRSPNKPTTSYSKFKPLSSLKSTLAIVNDPGLVMDRDPTREDHPFGIDAINTESGSGTAPPFPPATIPWIGASIAGALKTGGVEILKEKWHEAESTDDQNEAYEEAEKLRKQALCISDWTTIIK